MVNISKKNTLINETIKDLHKDHLYGIIKHFLTITLPELYRDNHRYIRFVFNNETLNYLALIDEKTTNYLKKIKDEYDINFNNNEYIYIRVDDYRMFFFFLNEIKNAYSKIIDHRDRMINDFINSLWIRMGQSDINNVNDFLRTQLIFLYTSNIFSSQYDFSLHNNKFFGIYNDLTIQYRNRYNPTWFESNNNITFYFRYKDDKNKHYSYTLPSVHYGLTYEDDKAVCYIYGIQQLSCCNDDIVKEKIQPLRKEQRNKYVSPDFIIALKFFINLLNENGFYTIKVPLLEVYNYAYHKHFSRNIKKSPRTYPYHFIDKFVNKEEIISKNKTERLVETFMVLSEKYDNIEFLSDPFIESDCLVINIKRANKKEI